MKEYLIRIYKDDKKICGFKVEVDDRYMARLSESALLTVLNRLANELGLRIEKEEFIVGGMSFGIDATSLRWNTDCNEM